MFDRQVAQDKSAESQAKDSTTLKDLSSRIEDLQHRVKEEVGKVHMTVGVAEAAALRAERLFGSGSQLGSEYTPTVMRGMTRESQLKYEVSCFSHFSHTWEDASPAPLSFLLRYNLTKLSLEPTPTNY